MSVGREAFDPATVTGVREVLSGARRRWFLKVWLRLGALTLCLAAAGLAAAWAVWRIVEPGAGVALALGSAVLGVTMAFLAWRAGPLRRRPSDRAVARYVEERVPELDEVFISAVQCLEAPRAPGFAGLVIDDAARRVSALDLDRVVSRQELRRRALEVTAAAVALIAVAVTLRDPLLQAIDVLRMAIAPASITIEVAPGDVDVREGETVSIRARAVGLPERLPREALTLTMDGARGLQDAPMAGRGEWQTFSLDEADESFEYRVSGYGVASGPHQVRVKPIPRVARIDVHYDYPAFTGLAPHIDEDAGDVYAPAGTKVRLVVHTTVPVPNAEMTLASGKTVALAAATAPGALDGRLTVTADDAYRLNLLEADGRRTPDSTEYFIRTVDDRPPEVQVLRPAGDRRVTRLEEVVIEARADDDFGVDRLELAYAARGGRERVVSLGGGRGPSVTGRHTLFLEDLDVQPGDFVSYYIKARDIGRGKRPTETRSDIFFLEVRPFNEEFEAAQSNAMSGGGGGSLDDLAARQKELIVATWKLERRAGAGRSGDDIRALARAQGELKTRAEGAASRMAPRAPQRRRPGQPAIPLPLGPPAADDPMRNAVAAMDKSQKALEALRTGDAIPHEMEALNQLLRAEADVRRRQVTRQQSASGRGGRSGNQDLSNLFDRELQRQQQTNYENRSSARQGQNEEEKESEALARLRELARRQDDVGRRAQELARRQAQLSPEDIRRQLERLTREQEELRRQAEQMAAQMQRQQAQTPSGGRGQPGARGQQAQQGQQGPQARSGGAGSDASNAESLRQAAEAMQQSEGGMNRDQLQQAASRAQRAAEQLRQAERNMAGRQPDEASRATGDAQLEAAQLAETERRIANELRNGQRASPDQLRQLAGQQERAAERAARLAERARDLPGGPGGEDTRSAASRDTRNAGRRPAGAAEKESATQTLASKDIERQLRASAQNLRDLAERGRAAGERDEQREAERAEGVARALERAARGLGGPGGPRDARADLSEQLARAGELGDRLTELSRQLRDGASAPRDGQQGSPDDAQARASGRAQGAGEQGAREATRGSQAGQQSGSNQAGQQSGANQAAGRATGGARGGEGTTGGASTSPNANAVEQELRSLQRLAETMGAEGDGLRRALQALEGYAPGRSAPGTEAWKQDFSRWEVLRKEIAATLEQFEARLSGELQSREREDRLDSGASDAAPETYRREVARYYRSIARKPTVAPSAPSKPPSPPSSPGKPGPSPSLP